MDRVPSNEVNPIAALQEAAKSFGLNPLVQSLAGLRYIDGKIEQSSTNKQNFSYDRHRLRFSRKSFPEFHDISIKTQDEVELQAHRCVLAARLDYFRSMFASGCWIEGQKNRTLKIPVQSKFMIPLLDFIYTDEFPSGIKSIDEAEFFCNLIVTADQFLAPRLVQMCERHLSGMLTLKNVGEILQFASDFSAKQLKQTCLQFVSQNLATLLEIKGLESLDVGHLRDLSHYYRRNFRHVDSRRLTPYETGPSIAEIESFYSGAGLTVGDVFAEEEEAAVSAAGQVKARKKSGSTGRSRRLSSESCSSDDDSRNSLKLCESIFDDLEEKSHPVNPVFDPVTPTSCETTENENFLKEFFSSPKQASPLQHSSESKRFHKLSQKERKRLASQSVATSTPKKENNSNDVTKEVETPKWTGWSTQTSVPSGMSTTSLAEIIEKEREQLKTMSITSDKQKLASKKSSWRQISFDDRQSVAESPPKNPWKVLPHQETPKASNGAPKNFHQILNEEVRQSENLVRAVSKPLWVTQIEEKAIEELKIFYNVDKVFDEHVKVSRVDDNRKMATPLWRKSLTKK